MNSYYRRLLSVLARIFGLKKVHFLHISKTGGTAVKSSLGWNRINSKNLFLFQGHDFTLKNLNENDSFILFVREPLSRYISGFYSRKRKGLPVRFNEWSKEEKIAFENFKTPNDLAEAIYSIDKNIQSVAQKAMKDIHHVKTSFYDWVVDNETFKEGFDKLFYLGFQENFEKDFNEMCEKLGFNVELEKSLEKAHVADKNEDRFLSETAIKNLKEWYKRDVLFYEYCKSIKTIVNQR